MGKNIKKVKTKKKRGWLFYLTVLFFITGLIGLGGVWKVYKIYSKDLPTLDDLAHYKPSLVTRVFARDYQMLGEFYIQRRQFVPFEKIPNQLVLALLAIEDWKFYKHPGIDPMGMFRAAIANVRAGRKVQGASTITQQVARTFLLTGIKTWERKIKEIILSLRIEQRFSKDEIIELYLNQVLLGSGAYGVGAASRIYFNKDVSELSLGQMALLAGLPQAPNRYNPWHKPERARKRQIKVLSRMEAVGVITKEQAQIAKTAPFGLARPPKPLEQIAPHFLEHVRRTIHSEWGYNQLYRGGLDVYTTLDPDLQRASQKAVRDGLLALDRRHGYRGVLDHLDDLEPETIKKWLSDNPEKTVSTSNYFYGLVIETAKKSPAKIQLFKDDKVVELPFKGVEWARPRLEGDDKKPGAKIKHINDVLGVGDIILVEKPRKKDGFYRLAQEPEAEAASISLDPHTGQILAMVGGYNFANSEFNRATQSKRQPGSAFKPFLYAAGLDQQYSPVDKIDDSPLPIKYRDPDTGELKVWRAENYEKKFYGPTTLRTGLAHSRNLVTIRLVKNIGISKMVPFLDKFGLPIPKFRQDLSLSLGSIGFTPLDMTSAYAVFANGGKLVEPVYIARVQDRFGRTVYRHKGGDCLLCHQEPLKDRPSHNVKSLEKEPEMASMFGSRVLDPTTAYQTTNLLKGVVHHGTGRRAKKLRRPLAGKTGTTNDLRDAWFMGFSPSLVTGVWVGMDDSTPLGYRETGATAALPIWIDVMRAGLKDRPRTDFPVPEGIHLEAVDYETGETLAQGDKHWVMEAFKKGQKPNPAKDKGVVEDLQDLEDELYQ
ncbi:MAG: PBP1A family penicillin-binding protein [Magnetococcales bacterium]|nr:PBP1A family penicillin-binding protein [Magnetococcales bacterium]